MSNVNTPAMIAQSMAESLFLENARLKKIEESYYRLLELDSSDVMIDTLNELDRLRSENAELRAALSATLRQLNEANERIEYLKYYGEDS
jgi:hypothetical protein